MPTLTPLQVAAAARLGGFRGDDIAVAVAVAKGESAYNTDAGPNSACNCRGLWQINLDAHKQYKAPQILHPVENAKAAHKIWAGDWCGGRTSGGACKKFEAYGKSDANGAWSAKLAEGRKAKADLDAQYNKDRLTNVLTFKSLDDTAVEILRKAGFDVDAPFTSREGFTDPLGDVGSFFSFPNVEGFFKALTSANTWQRVAQVLLGALLVTVGAVAVSGLAGKTPAGRVARALR